RVLRLDRPACTPNCTTGPCMRRAHRLLTEPRHYSGVQGRFSPAGGARAPGPSTPFSSRLPSPWAGGAVAPGPAVVPVPPSVVPAPRPGFRRAGRAPPRAARARVTVLQGAAPAAVACRPGESLWRSVGNLTTFGGDSGNGPSGGLPADGRLMRAVWPCGPSDN